MFLQISQIDEKDYCSNNSRWLKFTGGGGTGIYSNHLVPIASEFDLSWFLWDFIGLFGHLGSCYHIEASRNLNFVFRDVLSMIQALNSRFQFWSGTNGWYRGFKLKLGLDMSCLTPLDHVRA